MGFYEENKYFINQNLFSNMKHLNEEEKILAYSECKIKIREKVIKSYSNIFKCSTNTGIIKSKYFFYCDLIEYLNLYEPDYILINLFLDKNFEDIILIFLEVEEKKISKLLLNKYIKNKRIVDFYKEIIEFIVKFNLQKKVSSEISKKCENYITNEFSKIVGLDVTSWNNDKYNRTSSVNHLYPKYLITSLNESSVNLDKLILSYILFLKIWNCSEYFQSKKSTKSIMFVNHLIYEFNSLDNANNIKLFELINEIKLKIDLETFVEFQETPLTISENSEHIDLNYKQYVMKFKAILNRLERVSNYKSYTFYDLFIELKSDSIEELNVSIIKKINEFEYISPFEINKFKEYLVNNPNDEKLIRLIFSHFYLIEEI